MHERGASVSSSTAKHRVAKEHPELATTFRCRHRPLCVTGHVDEEGSPVRGRWQDLLRAVVMIG